MKCSIKNCNNESVCERYFVIPKSFYTENVYRFCKQHKDMKLEDFYFYDEDLKKILDIEEKDKP